MRAESPGNGRGHAVGRVGNGGGPGVGILWDRRGRPWHQGAAAMAAAPRSGAVRPPGRGRAHAQGHLFSELILMLFQARLVMRETLAEGGCM